MTKRERIEPRKRRQAMRPRRWNGRFCSEQTDVDRSSDRRHHAKT